MSRKTGIILLISALSALISLAGTVCAEVKGTYLYNLSSFTGAVATSSARVSIDALHKEVYLISGDLIRVFNSSGMEIFSFGEDLNAGVLLDAAAAEDGNIYVLSYSFERNSHLIILCDYRGEQIREITVTNIPSSADRVSPSRLLYRDKKLYLVSESEMVVTLTDADGVFLEQIDLFALMDIKPEKGSRLKKDNKEKDQQVKRQDHSISGFYVDHEGNMLFVSPIVALAYIVSPDRKIESFGKRGSAPGRFAVPKGMARDKSGNYFVSDILRCVVMIFDKKLDFISEFGYRGFGPGNLIGPTELTVDEDSKIYVTQLMDRGVSVFRLDQ